MNTREIVNAMAGTEMLEKLEGRFIPSDGATCFHTLDGSDVAAWLRSKGVDVVGYKDTGRNGLATTRCGFAVSTNGYVYKVK